MGFFKWKTTTARTPAAVLLGQPPAQSAEPVPALPLPDEPLADKPRKPLSAEAKAKLQKASFWVLLPFVVAFALGVLLRGDRIRAAVQDLKQIAAFALVDAPAGKRPDAARIRAEMFPDDSPASASDRFDVSAAARNQGLDKLINAVIGELPWANLEEKLAGGPPEKPGAADRTTLRDAAEKKRLVEQLLHSAGGKDDVSNVPLPPDRGGDAIPVLRRRLDDFGWDALWKLCVESVVVLILQAVCVFYFPALFVVHYAQVTHLAEGEQSLRADLRSDQMRQLLRQRARHLLEQETRPLFWRRFGFALLIVFGSTFFFAPDGIRAALIGEYVSLHEPPTESSLPQWISKFADAPHFMLGFGGFYLYAMAVFIQRSSRGDLSSRLMLNLFTRGVTVMILSVFLQGMLPEETFTRAFAFVVGVFPQTGLRALGKITQTGVERLSADEQSGFRDLPEIDLWKESTLGELGVLSMNDLARANWAELLLEVGINPYLLLRAADKALLLDTFGRERADKLAAIPLYTATELVEYLQPADPVERTRRFELVQAALEVADLSYQLERLRQNRNVEFLLGIKRN